MHYDNDFFDFQHTLSDEQRPAWLHDRYEALFQTLVPGSGRNPNKVLRFLRQSDFYSIPCRHHLFPGGNAWHQLEVFALAFSPSCPDADLTADFDHWQPLWLQLDPLCIAVASLLHDVCNAGHTGAVHIDYPSRIRSRHGRKSTFILAEQFRFDLMFDENMAIIHHQHKSEETLRHETPSEEDYQKIIELPLYHMIRLCDQLSISHPMTENQLTAALQHASDSLPALLKPHRW